MLYHGTDQDILEIIKESGLKNSSSGNIFHKKSMKNINLQVTFVPKGYKEVARMVLGNGSNMFPVWKDINKSMS